MFDLVAILRDGAEIEMIARRLTPGVPQTTATFTIAAAQILLADHIRLLPPDDGSGYELQTTKHGRWVTLVADVTR